VTATASESPRESVDHEQGSDRCKHSPSRSTGGIPAADRTYLATLIAARTGISQADAQQRVTKWPLVVDRKPRWRARRLPGLPYWAH